MVANSGTCSKLSMDTPEYVPSWLRNHKLNANDLDASKSDSGIKVAIKHEEIDLADNHSSFSDSEPEEEEQPNEDLGILEGEFSPTHPLVVNRYRLPVQEMLRWRAATKATPPLDACYGTEVIKDPVAHSSPFCMQSEEPRSSSRKLKGSENSWVAQQRAWQTKNAESCDDSLASDTQIAREVKSILNKLTIDKFDKLYMKLTECKIATPSHLQILISEIFEKATMQHHFINMYADLCSRLNDVFSERIMPDKPQNSFKRLLLSQCQAAFETNLVPPTPNPKLDQEERVLAEVRFKTKMLGNIRLVGALISRKMLSTKILYAILEELLAHPTPQALESVSVLLTTTGPTLDVKDSPYRPAFNIFFARVRSLVEQGSCEPRIQCLLKDALDLRANDWYTHRPQRLEAPSALGRTEQTVSEQGCNSNSPQGEMFAQAPHPKHVPDMQHVHITDGLPLQEQDKARLAELEMSPQVSKPSEEKNITEANLLSGNRTRDQIVDDTRANKMSSPPSEIRQQAAALPSHPTVSFWNNECKTQLQKALAEARYSHEVGEITNRLLSSAVPPQEAQPQVLHELLVCVSEEGTSFLRKAGFEAIFALYICGHWKPDSLREGITLFLRGMHDLICDVPNLVQIVREEMHAMMKPLVTKGMIPTSAYNALASNL